MNIVLALYRTIIRNVKYLPKEARNYYKEHTKEKFLVHRDETTQENITALVEKGKRDMEWILRKYNVKLKKK